MEKLKKILQGSWLKHPLHPVLAHVPMGLWPAACVFDVLTQFGVGAETLVRTSFFCIVGGLLAVPLAVPTGVALFLDVGRDKPAWRVGIYHMILTAVASVVWLVNAIVRARDGLDSAAVRPLPLALSIAGTVILLIGGYFGGRLTYDHGTFVGWYELDKWRQEAERGHARLPKKGNG